MCTSDESERSVRYGAKAKEILPGNSRRDFLKKIVLVSSMVTFGIRKDSFGSVKPKQGRPGNPSCTVFRSVNGKPDENLIKVIELAGRIEEIIGEYDVVVIKPNVQWWNQGAPNLLALKTFIELIMDRPGGFKGEVIVAENCHRGREPWKSRSSGWMPHFEWNSDIKGIKNMNELCAELKKKYGERFSVCHWIDVDAGGMRVYGPQDGPGYVYCDGTGGVPLISYSNGLKGDKRREVIMTYPIFQSDKGTIIDFKNGVWNKGAYTGQPLRFINFPALNHHSTYCGATSAIKNYLGISDLSGGADPNNGGRLTRGYYNFHSFPFDKWAPGPRPGMLGAEIAVFMNKVRKADLNITSAEWVGLASRVRPPMVRTRAVLASTDPVALDYHATKYLLYANSGMSIHNPDDHTSPLHQYLKACADAGGGIFHESCVAIKTFDFSTHSLSDNDDLAIKADRHWGTDFRTILKYFVLKYIKT